MHETRHRRCRHPETEKFNDSDDEEGGCLVGGKSASPSSSPYALPLIHKMLVAATKKRRVSSWATVLLLLDLPLNCRRHHACFLAAVRFSN